MMDIAALSTSMSQAQLFQQVNMSVAKMSMDQMGQSKEQFLDLIDKSTLNRTELEQSIQPHLGNKLDVFA